MTRQQQQQDAPGLGLQRGLAVRAGTVGPVPNKGWRSQPFGTQVRAKVISKGGHDYLHVEGYASVFDLEYDMWDMFGVYYESVDPGAFARSLANPDLDVAFLLNHRGMTMARTKGEHPTLRVGADDHGLAVDADLRMDRSDVQDLASAMDSDPPLIDEMSFAFMLLGGEWDEEYMHFQITEADINRGDVSAVNYGANPYTAIASRAPEILRELDSLPAGAARAALTRLGARRDLGGAASLSDRARAARADSDDTTGGLAAAVDAALDQAMVLVAGIDLTTLPEPVAQAIQLLGAADAASDELMEALGVYDPDDAGETELGHQPPGVRRRTIGVPAHVPGLGEPAQLSGGHGAFTGTHSHPHNAYGSQGADESHDHSHDHSGDGLHTHSHGKAAPAAPPAEGGQRSLSVGLLTAMHEADNAADADQDHELLGS